MNPDYTAAATAAIDREWPDADPDMRDVCIRLLAEYMDQGIRDYARGRLPPVGGFHKSGVAALLYTWKTPGVAI